MTHFSVELPLSGNLQDALIAEGLRIPDSLKDAHPGRKEKFLAGRYCALMALRKAGHDSPPLGIGILPDGSPAWPLGWVGSITHHERMAGAAVSRASECKGLGLDYELVMTQKTFENVAGRILIGKERTLLKPSHWNDREWTTFVFSAKESIYKCLRPLCGEYFGFEAAELNTLEESGSFTFHLTKDIGGGFQAGQSGQGRFEKLDDQIFTAVELR